MAHKKIHVKEKHFKPAERAHEISRVFKQQMKDSDPSSAKDDALEKTESAGESITSKGTSLSRSTYLKTKEAVKQHMGNSGASQKKDADIKTKSTSVNRTPKTKSSFNGKPRNIYQTKNNVKKTTLKTKKAVHKAKKASAATKKLTRKTIKTTRRIIKSVITAARAAVSALKSLVAAIAAGGWVVIVIILVITLIIVLAASPWGIFFEDMDDTTPTIPELVADLNDAYTHQVNAIIKNAGDIDALILDNELDTLTLRPYNWADVLGVFAVKLSANPEKDAYMDVLIMDDKRVKALESVFWDMNQISYEIIETIVEPEPTPLPTNGETSGPAPTPQIIRTLIIRTDSLAYSQGAAYYNFDDNQNKLLEELMSPEYYAMFQTLCGMNAYIGLTPEQLKNLINDLPAGTKGALIVKFAASRLGDPYSQSLRGQGNYVDCSYLSRWCYQQAGVTHFTAPTAAAQAEYCVNNGLTVSRSDLLPGDLIFWSFKPNGRFLNVTHVGIFAGNGMVIDASYSNGMVVYRPLFATANQVCYGRPHVK